MKSVLSHGRKSVDCGDANIQGISLVHSAMLPDRGSDFYLLLSRANRTEDRGVPKFELNLHCEMHSPAPSPVPTPVPTVPLRGMRDCVCMSERWIAKLNIHCPEVAKHFDSGCLTNMTTAVIESFVEKCPPLRTEFFVDAPGKNHFND